MKKSIVWGICFLFAMIVFSMALNNFIRSQFNDDKISIVLTGSDGNKVYGELTVNGETSYHRKTLPARFTLQGSNVEYKIALMDAEHGEPFEIKVMKNNKDVLTSIGKGLKGELKTSKSCTKFLFITFCNNSSSVSSSNMSDDEVKKWIRQKV